MDTPKIYWFLWSAFFFGPKLVVEIHVREKNEEEKVWLIS